MEEVDGRNAISLDPVIEETNSDYAKDVDRYSSGDNGDRIEIHRSAGGFNDLFSELGFDEDGDKDKMNEGQNDDKTHNENANDEDDDDYDWAKFEPSISDRLQVGYYRMDRACQTSSSELVNLKALSELLAITTVDIKALKKNVYYAKLTLQAEYDGRLKDEISALQKRVADKLAEVKTMHFEKIEVLRRSYRTQLANVLCKLSRDYHRYYGKIDADIMESHRQKVSDLERQREESRKNEMREKELSELLRLQAEQVTYTVEEDSVSIHDSMSDSNTKYQFEIEELNDNIDGLEKKVEYLENLLEETNDENKKMISEVDKLTWRLNNEQEKTIKLNGTITELNQKLSKERYQAQERLNQQKEKLKEEMDSKLDSTRQKMLKDSNKQVEEMKRLEAEKLRQIKLIEEKKMKELMTSKEEEEEEEVVVVTEQPIIPHDMATLLQVQQSQKEEIITLQKELNRKTKLWEMKIKILQEHIHVLKDEMFLRTSLQRQSAKMKQAALTYTKHGSHDVPLGVNPVDERKIQRKHRLPTIVQSPSNKLGKAGGEIVVNSESVAAEFCKCK